MPPRSRVVLRPPTPADEREFLAHMKASRSVHRPWLYPPVTADEYRAYLQRLADDRKVGYLACRREDGAIVGFFNVLAGEPAGSRRAGAQSERCETTLTSVPLGSRSMKRRTPHSSSRSE